MRSKRDTRPGKMRDMGNPTNKNKIKLKIF